MACCGKNKKNTNLDKNGNSLKKYAFLNPSQLALRDAAEKALEEQEVVVMEEKLEEK